MTIQAVAGREAHGAETLSLSPKEVMRRLKARDNVTNIYYLGRIYVIIAAAIAATLWSYDVVAAAGLGWWWNIPATIAAILVIGASQHQLGGAVHEGTHYMLFRNRKMSELVSDWFAAFPIFTTTYAFRMHHLAHHQFINDPERDPNFAMTGDSGHWLHCPVSHLGLIAAILRQLSPVRLVSYLVARSRHSAIGSSVNPYADPKYPGSKIAVLAGVLYVMGTPLALIPLTMAEQWMAAALVLGLATAGITLYYTLLPDKDYIKGRIEPVIPHRVTAISRMVFAGLLYSALTFAAYTTGAPVWGYFLLFWIVPLAVAFPVFMILREWLQHANGDRGRYTNSRVLLVNPFLRYAVFPFGQDYHLPHHIFAAVPHYNLKALHEYLLREDPEYARKCLEVEGWARRNPRSGRPTIVDMVGPAYTPSRRDATFVDMAALDEAVLTDSAAIRRHVEQSLSGSRGGAD